MRALGLAFVASVLACSSSSGSSGPSASTVCADECNAEHKCTATVDVDTCTKSCENKGAAVAPNLRGDYLSAYDGCVNGASCDTLASCGAQASASIAASGTATDFCNKLIAKQKACSPTSIGDLAGCLNAFKILTDGALSGAESCFDKACSDYQACLKADFGL
jgi:hypothetical protein